MKNKGFSYLEMMIVLFLTSFIVQTLLYCYAQSKQQELHFQKTLNQSLEIQWVQDLLSNSIRHAGFSPCMGINYLNLPFKGIQVEHDSALKIHRMDTHFSQLIRRVNEKQLLIEGNCVFRKKQKILIAGCEHGQMNQISDLTSTEEGLLLTLQKPIYKVLDEKSYVGILIIEKWFIKERKGLFYEANHVESLSSMIEKMQVYSKDTLYEVIFTLVGGVTHHFSVRVRSL